MMLTDSKEDWRQARDLKQIREHICCKMPYSPHIEKESCKCDCHIGASEI